MNNPLAQYYRAPKLYVKLPSQEIFYTPDMVDKSVNGEVAVYAMSALDQINIRTPDALLNGDAMVKVIGSCVPGVKNPKELVEPDINTLLLAIRIASSGPQMEVPAACPKCNHDNNYQVDLPPIIESQSFSENNNSVEIDGALAVHLRPYNFNQRNLSLLNEIQETQAVTVIQNNDQIDDTTKFMELGHHVTKMAERTFDIVAHSITHITILKTGEIVDNREHIQQFLKNISKAQADSITDKIKQLNQVGIDTKHTFVCDSCAHEWKQPIDFDPSSFFV
jgi:hypothetical protein